MKLFNALVVPVLTYAFWAYPMTAECILHVHVATNKLLRHALGLRVEFSDPDVHTHTEELYTTTAFVPLSAHASLLRQWGHWVRAADRRPRRLTVTHWAMRRARRLYASAHRRFQAARLSGNSSRSNSVAEASSWRSTWEGRVMHIIFFILRSWMWHAVADV
eukprot:PhM_4_TR5189/c5_g1_i3/m.99192